MKKYILTIAVALAAVCFIPSEASAFSMLELIEIDRQQVQISVVEGNQIRIVGGSGMVVQVYNIAGQCIHTTKIDGADRIYNFNLTKGCYIIKVGNTTRKVSIK